ncbi:MAG TPA: hypothetical protein VME24_11675 [Alphaproteobacteria bacterium]|nr:hypothetical protein [Alphaproteobacteria bacterium]
MNETKNIPPLRLILEGQFWDSHLYMGTLYLFTRDGVVHLIDWDRLVSQFPVPADLALPMQCAFSRSDDLYDPQRDLIHQDPQVREVLQGKFVRLAKHHQTPRVADWRYHLVRSLDSPFPFPHLDAIVYNKGLFSVSENGVYVISTLKLQAKQSKSANSPQGMRLWDCPVISLDASYGALALAAGAEGLFQLELQGWDSAEPRETKPVDKRDCTDCSWAYYSIMGSSHLQGGIFAEFVKENGGEGPAKNGHASPQDFEPTNLGRSWRDAPKLQRRFEKAICPAEIFKEDGEGYCWGGKDKICQAREGTMTVAQYSPWENEEAERLRVLRQITFDPGKRNPVCGAVAPFGSIIELDKCMVIVRSDDELLTIPGVPVNWRVFNRSRQYENQLHVIYENRLEVFSFNHDYFIDQKEKFSGVRAFGSNGVKRLKS